MLMRILPFLICLTFTAPAIAQTDSLERATADKTFVSAITISKSQIERLPATNFMELVNGAFAFAFDTRFVADYAFVEMDLLK